MPAITDAYATAQEYRDQIGKTDPGEDAEVLRNLTAISRIIEIETRPTFNKDAAPTVRLYDPTSPDELEIDDLVSATEIAVDTNNDRTFATLLTATTQYELHPLNAPLGSEPAPYERIILRHWGATNISGWYGARWPGITNPMSGRVWYYRVRVTGIFGWPAVPVAIKEACIQLTAILRIETPRATSRVDEAGRVLSTSRAATEIVERLKKGYERSSPKAAEGSFFLV